MSDISLQESRRLALAADTPLAVLRELACSSDRITRLSVAGNPCTPQDVLMQLARTFPIEVFSNPAFDLLVMENPRLFLEFPASVLRAILKHADCPDYFIKWAMGQDSAFLHLSIAMRNDVSKEVLEKIARGPYVKASELAAHKLMLPEQK